MALTAACNTVLRYQRPPLFYSPADLCKCLRISSCKRCPSRVTDGLQPEENCYSTCALRSPADQVLQNPSDIPPKRASSLDKTPQTKQLFRLLRTASSLPVPSLIQSEEGEGCPIYEFCSVQWHIVISNHENNPH